MQSDHFVEVMALLNAIVRCFNENIGNVDMNKLARPVLSAHSITALTMSTMDAEKA
jgi:hypothetical protein